MAKPTQTNRSDKAAPSPVDDPLAQLIDQHSDEIEPVATTSDGEEVEAPAGSDENSEPTT